MPFSLAVEAALRSTTTRLGGADMMQLKPAGDADPLANAEYLGLVALVAPVFGSVVHGGIESWQTSFLLAFTLGYLINITKSPWAVLHAAHARRVTEPGPIVPPDHSGRPDALEELRRRKAQRQLAIIEALAVVAVVGSPFAGGYILSQLRQATAHSRRFVDPFAVKLFIYAASFKPFKYLISRLKAGTLFRVVSVRFADPELAGLDDEVHELQEELISLEATLARRDEVSFLRDEAAEPLLLLDKAVRSHESKSAQALLASSEAFEALESRMEGLVERLDRCSAVTDELEEDAEVYRRSRYAAMLTWANAWLGSLGAGLSSFGQRLENRPEPRMIAARNARPRSSSNGSTVSMASSNGTADAF